MPLSARGILLRLEAKADSSPACPFLLFFFAAVSAFQSSHLCQGLYFGICGNRLVWANRKLEKPQQARSPGPPSLLQGQADSGRLPCGPVALWPCESDICRLEARVPFPRKSPQLGWPAASWLKPALPSCGPELQRVMAGLRRAGLL